MSNPTEVEIGKAYSAINWSKSACGMASHKDPAIATLFEDPELNPDRSDKAKKLCIGCPILGECLIYAIKYETPLGKNWIHTHVNNLMGGFTMRERQKIKQSPMWEKFYANKP